MKGTLLIGLLVGGSLAAIPAHAEPDWTRVCTMVGHAAALVAAGRDQHLVADVAVSAARRILAQPPMLTDTVGAEIAAQVYRTPNLSPAQEAARLRAECLTPADAPQPARDAGPPPSHDLTPGQVRVLAPLELHTGDNQIAHLLDGGRDAVITLTWQDDGHGRGHDVFTVKISDAGPVTMTDGTAITDDPGNDRDMLRSVRFARGQVDGADVLLLLIASRQPGEGPTPTVYRVFGLRAEGGGFQFVPLLATRLPMGFCNADMALSVASGLPLRASYRGLRTTNGCPVSSN